MSEKTIVQAFIVFVVALVIFGLAALVLRAPARSQGWPESEFRAQHRKNVVRRHVHPKTTHRRRDVRKVIVIPPRPSYDDRCSDFVSAVGRDALTDGGAEANAERAWQELVRFRHGEVKADPVNAVEITKQCVASSIRNAATRAAENIGLDVGKKRCEMRARPCSAPRLGEARR